jgi:glucose/arabinose dehydrogenase
LNKLFAILRAWNFCRCSIWPFLIVTAAISCSWRVATAQPFTVQGPGVNSNDFRVTTFATGLSFPIGMVQLSDGSVLVAINEGSSYLNSVGKIIRLTDTNQNGVADGPPSVLYSGLPPGVTALRAAGNLFIATGDTTPISILRRGNLPSDPLLLVGQVIINYPGPGRRQHSATALGVRKTLGYTNRFDIFFQLGAEYNFGKSTNSLSFTNSNIPGASGVLVADAAHMLTLIDNGTNVTATNCVQIASGLRNAAGFTFNPATGDLYLQDNGIDGLVDANEPLSADEVNFIARTNIGSAVQFFGYPTNYTAYRTGTKVGGAGIQPRIAFQPLPNPTNGRESEGPFDMTFAPPGFPNGLNTGIFMGFHGKYTSAGTANEENPVVYADPVSSNYFHFILGQQAGIGHLDGLLATRDSLFVADMTTNGNIFSSTNAGVIYQIKSLVPPVPPSLGARFVGTQIELSWDRGGLQEAADASGPWSDVSDGFSPYAVEPNAPQKFYRARF